jgi:hypothetical protein
MDSARVLRSTRCVSRVGRSSRVGVGPSTVTLLLAAACSVVGTPGAAHPGTPVAHPPSPPSTITGARASTDWRWLIVTDGPEQDAERAVLVAALRLLPRLPARLAVIDALKAKPDVQPRLLALDAFVVVGSPVVYIVRQSALFQGALRQGPVHLHALAAVLWHEMAHIEGADERGARRREQALWTTFVRDQRVDDVAALRYLKTLNERPDDQLLATRPIR